MLESGGTHTSRFVLYMHLRESFHVPVQTQLSTDSPGANGHPSCRDLINQGFDVRCVLFSKCIGDVDTQDN